MTLTKDHVLGSAWGNLVRAVPTRFSKRVAPTHSLNDPQPEAAEAKAHLQGS